MHPVLLQFDFGGTEPFTIHTYGIIRLTGWLLLGVLLILPTWADDTTSKGVAVAKLVGVLLVSALFAAIAVVVHLVRWSNAKDKVGRLLLAAFAALIGADTLVRTFPAQLIVPVIVVVGLVILDRKHPLSPQIAATRASVGVALFLGLLWSGCLAAGCHSGEVCHLPWCVEYPVGSMPAWEQTNRGLISITANSSLPVHPIQLYGVLTYVVLAGVVAALSRWKSTTNNWILVAVGLTAIVVELVLLWAQPGSVSDRGDHLITSQMLTAVIVFMVGLYGMVRRGKGREATA